MLVEADDYFEDSMIPLKRFQGTLPIRTSGLG